MMKMKKGTMIWIGVGVVVLFLVLWVVAGYNRFISLEQNINGKWSEVESQYQRQADLIPNLVSATSSAVKVETQFVKDVVAARVSWASAASQLEKDTAGQQMNNGISAFVAAVAENYPTLQANKQYIALTDELSGTQNRITTARGRYIEGIQSYNTAIKRFPGNVLAGIFGFEAKDYYKAESGTTTSSLGTGVLP